VLAVLADRHAALAAGRACLAGIELVRRTLLVGCAPALAGNLALLGPIHRRETTVAAAARGCPGLRSVGHACDVLAVGRTGYACAFVRDLTLLFPIRAVAALFVIRFDRHLQLLLEE
jgi:hypothetical protein